MPAKKAALQKAPSSEAGMVWKWVYVVGIVVAGLWKALNFTAADPYLGWLLILAAVLLGWFYFDPEEIEHFGLRVLILSVVFKALDLVPFGVGTFISGFFGGWVFFLFAVVLTMAFHFFWNRRIATLF